MTKSELYFKNKAELPELKEKTMKKKAIILSGGGASGKSTQLWKLHANGKMQILMPEVPRQPIVFVNPDTDIIGIDEIGDMHTLRFWVNRARFFVQGEGRELFPQLVLATQLRINEDTHQYTAHQMVKYKPVPEFILNIQGKCARA
ncbi:hypothetical protein EFA69_16220 [Rufibacter immobilis]|uniref:Uncharacterized protein n=1 Tax=Rufibacter immobilis TaxID=1348778 RepID=A0A3M9MRZ7_9BACT|nr:hypothetical protein [Rufibacter immobilis]RNI27663.1 hypothetical protein EFA69_16220 [Rufibacter immobilis]